MHINARALAFIGGGIFSGQILFRKKPTFVCFVWFYSLRPLNNLSVLRDGLPGLNQY